MDRDPKRDELERRRDDARRLFDLAIAEANQAWLGSVEYRDAMERVRAAVRDLDAIEARMER